ncbi:MAG TPA: biotin/lipoyl-containing protein [Terriglobia bacterium]|jgi:biotin carboxyl carrier protein
MKYSVIVAGEPVDVEIDLSDPRNIQAQIAGRTYTLEAKNVEPGVYWFSWNNRSIELAVTAAREGYEVSVGGRHHAVEIVDARAALRKATHHSHDGEVELRAPMPGKIVKMLLQPGDEVHANQGVLVMEAMKMQNEIKSPKDGIVKRVAVQEAAAVNAGDLLAVVE